MTNLRRDSSGVSCLRDNGIFKTYLADSLGLYTLERKQVNPFKRTKPIPRYRDISIDSNRVKKLLDRLDPNKASGPDDLSTRVLKYCSAEIAQVLACTINQSLIQAIISDDWRQANVAPIYKKGEKYDQANYRPVSLTCICCKTFEHILASKIVQHLSEHGILVESQHGFRSGRSCETQLVQFIRDLCEIKR